MRATISLFTGVGTLFVASIILSDASGQEVGEKNPTGTPSIAAVAEDIDDIFGVTTSSTSETDSSSTKVTDPDSPLETSTDESPSSDPLEGELKESTSTEKTPSEEPKTATVESTTKPTDAPAKSTDPTVKGKEPAAGDAATKPEQTAEPLTPELVRLRERVRDCLGHYYGQQENVVDHSPWGVMHILIAYGVDTQVYANSKRVNAIGYLCFNGQCRGQQLFFLNRGRLETRVGPGVQGHDGQFLAMMAQSRVKIDYPMHVDGKELKISDLVEYEKRTCEAGTELTFKLIGLSHYLDTEATWKNQAGEDWSIPRLIREELAQPIIGAACGGTHRLMGFNYAVRKREKEGKPMTGQWTRARKFLDDYFEYTYHFQNPDGSFSTDFFRGPNSYGDINQRIETTGHILEWFVASLNDKQLRDPRVIKAVDYLTNLMLQNRRNEWEIGPKGHALHALAIYSERVFGDNPGTRDAVLARGKKFHVDDQRQR